MKGKKSRPKSSKGSKKKDSGPAISYPHPGTEVATACGGIVRYEPNTPSALFNDEVVYFCLPICKADYEESPHTSCLAARISSAGE